MLIDLNSDVGESFGRYTLGEDELVMLAITSANIACGFHAGDPGVIRATLSAARKRGVACGAHPGYPDLVGFGRRDMAVSPEEIFDDLVYQVGAVWAAARVEGVKLTHVKPHGALYNRAARDHGAARAIAEAVRSLDLGLILVGLAGSEMGIAAKEAGVGFAGEAFADRVYRPDGALAPRSQPGAVVHDPDDVLRRAISIARDQLVWTSTGEAVPVHAHTICLHGDTTGAARLGALVRAGIEDAGVRVVPLLRVLEGANEG
ncbi:MAG: 5-oxoprolinase subunit PxpA [Clostridia bacterium]|nr:5-oxoprolinase subunit PxpA [Clostridia bacterium]